MDHASVRYIVTDVDAAVVFYAELAAEGGVAFLT